ncbi:hypothetical protein [Erwinia sp. V71]|uniref:hypothetical protein n=1 Tax=Erwinia sp. V71 TaxID=3369424 RepID=UPI003F5F29BF
MHFELESAANKTFSVNIGLTASLSAAGFSADAEPRKSMYFKIPGTWRSLQVINQEGQSATVQVRVSAFAARYNTRTSWTLQQHSNWRGGSFVYAPSPCAYSGIGYYNATAYQFMWKWPESNAACYKIPGVNLTGEPHLINNISIGYELKTPDPMKMASGQYNGTLRLRAGPGGDFDFGDNFAVNDSNIDFVFRLSVNHELKLSASASDQQVTLRPCTAAKVCSEEEGKASWERWMITRIAPQLTGRSQFSLSSSGAFTVYLQCEHRIGTDCALKSDQSAQQVAVQARLTLADNIADNATGAAVVQRRLFAGRDATRNIFMTKTFAQSRTGSIDFLVTQRDVETMLQTRPDTYRGAVTVIFDPKIY